MLYHSTRSEAHFVDSAEAVLEGLAPDGGLYMPESIPAFDWQACLRGSSTEMSAKILAALLPDIPDMDTLVRRAYQGKFETEDLTPTVSVGGYSVLELFRGPTSAFKDVALSMLPQLLTAAKAVKGMEKDILILTATSGDTGKAALEGLDHGDGDAAVIVAREPPPLDESACLRMGGIDAFIGGHLVRRFCSPVKSRRCDFV